MSVDWEAIRASFRMECERIMKGYAPPIDLLRPSPWTRAGWRLADMRRAKGMTQQRLGEIAGYDQALISKIELAQRNPTPRQRADIAQALGVEVEAIWW